LTPGETITTKQGEELRIIKVNELDLVCVNEDKEVKLIKKVDVIWIQKCMF